MGRHPDDPPHSPPPPRRSWRDLSTAQRYRLTDVLVSSTNSVASSAASMLEDDGGDIRSDLAALRGHPCPRLPASQGCPAWLPHPACDCTHLPWGGRGLGTRAAGQAACGRLPGAPDWQQVHAAIVAPDRLGPCYAARVCHAAAPTSCPAPCPAPGPAVLRPCCSTRTDSRCWRTC